LPYAVPASSQYRPKYGVDKEQCGGWCKVALKSVITGLVSQVQGGVFKKSWFWMVETKSHFLREGDGPSFVSSGFNSGFHAFSLFML
jgi:hypothetical protein